MKKTKFLAALAAIILALPACGNSNHPATDAAPTDTVVQNDSLTPSTPKSDTLTLAMVGDIMMGTTYPDSVHGSALPADRGRRLFDDAAPILRRVDSLDEAVREARALAAPGDVVVLSPACASFDMFRNFMERGDRFRELVSALN